MACFFYLPFLLHQWVWIKREMNNMSLKKCHLGGTVRSPEDVNALQQLGLKFGEVSTRKLDVFLAHKNQYAALKETLDFYYVCHAPQEGDPNDKGQLERRYLPLLLDLLSVMPDLDMKLLTLHCWVDQRYVKKEVVDYKIRLLERVVDQAAGSGITVCLENLSEHPEDFDHVLEALPGLNLTLDVGHAQLLTPQNTACDITDAFPDRIAHIHLHDNQGGDSPSDDIHLPLGEGIIDFSPIFSKLKEINYSNTMTLELRPAQIKQCLEFVKGLMKQEDV